MTFGTINIFQTYIIICMYFEKIDTFIDDIFDDFYGVSVQTNKIFKKIIGDTNFVRQQKELNDIIDDYIKTIPSSVVDSISKKGDVITQLYDTIARYIVIYTFLTIGIFYKAQSDMFINNIVEFSRNQAQYPIKIDNFFNSDGNSIVINLFHIAKNIISLVATNDISKTDIIKNNPLYNDTLEFIAALNPTIIDKAFRLKNLNNDKELQAHNISKTLILINLYKKYDKKSLHSMIEQSNATSDEYMFIDVVEPITNTINFNSVEEILQKKNTKKGLVYDIWNFLVKYDACKNKVMTSDDKINMLINNNIIIPILDDFLLFHKDNEKYDKTIGTTNIKKKEDTKIRYIVGKIDATSELYSENAKKDPKQRETIMNNFYSHMYEQKAILRNHGEEIKIINKLMNQGKRNTENEDYLNDLLYYRKYAFANFKEFEHYGFSNYFTKTATSVRAVNFVTSGEFAQKNPQMRLQIRVGGKDNVGNVVGFLVPSNVLPMQCIKIADAIDVRTLSKKTDNGFDILLSFLKQSRIENKPHNSTVFWLFDLDKDHATNMENKYVDMDKITMQDNIKNMMGMFYDRFVTQVYHKIIDGIQELENGTINDYMNLVERFENHIFPLNNEICRDIEHYIFKSKIDKSTEIMNDNILYGLEGNIFELPTHTNTNDNKIQKIIVDTSHIGETGELIEIDEVRGICQHNVTWDEIGLLRKTNHREYTTKLYLFNQQYVTENTHGEYICKSCGGYLDLKKYIADGSFDEETQRFVTFSLPMQVNLEDIPEYEKYHFAIKIMDKNIEKIASSVGIPYFVGSSTTIKWRRKGIIKDIIDMIVQNNELLGKKFKERNEMKTSLYGISKSLSNLFVFEMDNSIFVVSSKDKDQEQYKIIKKNNILIYTMIYMILEINESQVTFFAPDKKHLCDIKIFDKVYTTLFGGLQLKKNNTNNTVAIVDYKMLCYMIYMISCRLAKHNMWSTSHIIDKNSQKLIPVTQKFIVNTCVDIINSIMENSFENNANYIFEMFRVRFLTNLNSFYKDNGLFDTLLGQNQLVYSTVKKRIGLTIVTDDKIQDFAFDNPLWRKNVPNRYFLPLSSRHDIQIYTISEITHCPDGNLHKWQYADHNLSCAQCKHILTNHEDTNKTTTNIVDMYKKNILNQYALQYCQVDGQPHIYVYSDKIKKNICVKCKNDDTHRYTDAELANTKKIMISLKTKKDNDLVKSYQDQTNTALQINTTIGNVIGALNESYKHSSTPDNKYAFINAIIDDIKQSIGEDQTKLYDNIYIIDHTYTGIDLKDKPITIVDSDKKMATKIKHPHYETDVIYYTDHTNGRVDVFYDAISKTLLGYKESGKDYVDIPNSRKKIQINYSTYNKLKLLGYRGEYINTNYSQDEELIQLICRERIDNLKKATNYFRRIIFSIINKQTFAKAPEIEETYFADKINNIIIKYTDKLNELITKNKDHHAFENWRYVEDGIHSGLSNTLNIDVSNFHFVNDVETIDNNVNLLLFYLINEMRFILAVNKQTTNAKIGEFIVDFIDMAFSQFNLDVQYTNHDIWKFVHTVNSFGFVKEIGDMLDNDEDEFDNENKLTSDEIEEAIDIEEEMDALDMDEADIEEGVESTFDQQVEMEPIFEL